MKHLLLLLLCLLLAGPAVANDTVYYYSSDTLHSEVVITDAHRNVVERTYYAPYGQVLNRALRDGPGYTGHEEDPETSLVYMQQRYYDPESGRFLSIDPVVTTGDGDNFNHYWYANDNPYRYTDPDGRQEADADARVEGVPELLDPKLVDSSQYPSSLRAPGESERDFAVRKAYAEAQECAAPGVRADYVKVAEATEAEYDSLHPIGKIYRVEGDRTPSKKPYIGRTKQSSPAARGNSDGRDRSEASIVDRYDASDFEAARRAEQRAINQAGGIENLDNKRNEIRPDKWSENGIDPLQREP